MDAGPPNPELPTESAPPPSFGLADYHALAASELRARALGLGLGSDGSDLQELVAALVRRENGGSAIGTGGGILDVRPEGFGFLRHPRHHCRAGADDIYLSANQVHRLHLQPGSRVEGLIRMPRTGERYFAMVRVETVEGLELEVHRAGRPLAFPQTTPILPRRALPLAIPDGPAELRMVDLLAPLAHGHRVLIRVGTSRRTLLQDLATGVRHNHPTARVVLLLIDQTPEDRTVAVRAFDSDPNVETYVTTFDEPPERHAELMDLVHARVLRLIENRDDVVLIVDSWNRLVRAFGASTAYTGKMITAGLDSYAFLHPKRLLSCARQTEEGPALTILGTVESATAIDEAIADELATRCNAEIVFDPEIDVHRTGTRREDCPIVGAAVAAHERLRAGLAGMTGSAARQHLMALIAATSDNAELLARSSSS